MKKLLLLTFVLTLLAACSKEGTPTPEPKPEPLVRDIVMPVGECKVSAPVTINGTGFLKGDFIFLNATANLPEISAEVTEVTESHIVFIVPADIAAGKTSVVLRRETKTQILGDITIAKVLPPRIFGTKFSYDLNQTELFEIDLVTGVATIIETLVDRRLFYPVTCGHTIYAINNISDAKSIFSYNIDTKEAKVLTDQTVPQDVILGVINGKLHMLVIVDENVKLISIDDQTGAQTEVANFGKLQNAIEFSSWNRDLAGFAYDVKNNKIILYCSWFNPITVIGYDQTVVLDLSTKTIEYFDHIIISAENTSAAYFMRGNKVCRIDGKYNEEIKRRTYTFVQLNDEYQVEKEFASVNSNMCAAYDAVQDIMYVNEWLNFRWGSIDLKTTPATIEMVECTMQLSGGVTMCIVR